MKHDEWGNPELRTMWDREIVDVGYFIVVVDRSAVIVASDSESCTFRPSTQGVFAHTVGLHHRYDKPEFIVCGLDGDESGEVLEELAERVVSGYGVSPGPVELLAHPGPTRLDWVHRCQWEAEWFELWLSAYRPPSHPPGLFSWPSALQLVWSELGVYPDHPSAEARLVDQQPLLNCCAHESR